MTTTRSSSTTRAVTPAARATSTPTAAQPPARTTAAPTAPLSTRTTTTTCRPARRARRTTASRPSSPDRSTKEPAASGFRSPVDHRGGPTSLDAGPPSPCAVQSPLMRSRRLALLPPIAALVLLAAPASAASPALAGTSVFALTSFDGRLWAGTDDGLYSLQSGSGWTAVGGPLAGREVNALAGSGGGLVAGPQGRAGG